MFLAYALAGILVPSAIVQRRVARIRDLFDRGQEVARRPGEPETRHPHRPVRGPPRGPDPLCVTR